MKTPMQQARTTSFWRSLKYGANTTVMTLIVLGIIVIVEAISARHSYRWDVTSNQRYTLSDQTTSVVSGLTSDVKILAFYSVEQGDRVAFEDRLKQYAALSKQIPINFRDAPKNMRSKHTARLCWKQTKNRKKSPIRRNKP